MMKISSTLALPLISGAVSDTRYKRVCTVSTPSQPITVSYRALHTRPRYCCTATKVMNKEPAPTAVLTLTMI